MEVHAHVDLVRDFVNTYDLEDSTDALDSGGAARAWLEKNGLPAANVSDDGAARLRQVREAIRDVLKANNGMPLDPAALDLLEEAARRAPLRVAFSDDGRAALEPVGDGADAAVGRILAAIERAQAEGAWERMKACPAEDCHWAFYDESRNRSRTWCSMKVCGNRAKARSYRARSSDGA